MRQSFRVQPMSHLFWRRASSGLLITGITQELKSAIRCWCYGQHQHCNNSCYGNVPQWLTVSQHTHELCQFSAALRPHIPRYLAASALSEGSLVPTAVGILCPRARVEGRLSSD